MNSSKRYKLSNRLGNVRVVLNDKKTPVNSGTTTLSYMPQVVSVTDYYSFGLEINERTYNYSTPYRYYFNGKENIEQRWYQDYGARYYHKAIGRFISADPLIVKEKKYSWLSSYQFAANTPIQAKDLDGLEADFKFDSYQRQKDAQILGVDAEYLRKKELDGIANGLMMLPIASDVHDAYDLYQSIKNRDWMGVMLSAVSFVPFADIATKPAKGLVKAIKKAAEGLNIQEIKHIAGSGTFDRVAVIGRKSDDRIKPFAAKLKEQGVNVVEPFSPSGIAKQEFKELPENSKIKNFEYGTIGFKENLEWRYKLAKEGVDVLDIGSGGAKGKSIFYNMEIDAGWKTDTEGTYKKYENLHKETRSKIYSSDTNKK